MNFFDFDNFSCFQLIIQLAHAYTTSFLFPHLTVSVFLFLVDFIQQFKHCNLNIFGYPAKLCIFMFCEIFWLKWFAYVWIYILIRSTFDLLFFILIYCLSFIFLLFYILFVNILISRWLAWWFDNLSPFIFHLLFSVLGLSNWRSRLSLIQCCLISFALLFIQVRLLLNLLPFFYLIWHF
jgi:hypothetical protein